jgi:tetratricopeptide (TPR) repeat protein
MDKDLAQKSVSAALSGNWKEAIKLNLQILKGSPKDVDALNRLARAYAENCNIKKAKCTCEKVLKLDPFNSIANKAMNKWKAIRSVARHQTTSATIEDFLEEPGKTKMISLIHLGDTRTINKLDSGDEVKLDTHSHRVSVSTQDAKYLGRLPDDLSARLRTLIASGNEYKVFIKCISPQDVKIFIKETKSVTDVPSFPSEKIEYTSYTPPELVHKNDVEFPQEED